MSITFQPGTEEKTVPPWIYDMEFCHIRTDEDETLTYCGMRDERPLHGDYDGEAICPYCGLPTCPRCAQLAELDLMLEAS